ncbi:MAG: pitrilysin family protein [Patescibacteria group bacterium]
MKPIPKKLKNGMPVLLVPQKGAISMTLLVLVKVGSRYETREINGASHFIEHLMFKGTAKRPTTETISRELDRYGAEYNAYTDKDLTGYYIKMDAGHTPLAIDMLHDMLFHSKYDSKEIDRERGVIVEEINMYEDNPRSHVDDLLEEVMFPNSTLGWNVAGPREVIRSISRDQLIGYRDAYYIPERMTVVVAGKIMPGTLALLEKTFGRVTRKTGEDQAFDQFETPAKLTTPISYQEKATEQVQFAMSFYGLKLDDPSLPAAGLLSSILGGTMSSRLFIQIRERRGLCYSIHAMHQAREDIGMFGIFAGLEKKRFHEAVKAVIKELKSVMRDGVTSEELKRAKDNIKGRTTLAFEDSATQAEWYGKEWLFRRRVETPEERLRRYEKVTGAEVRKVARAIFRPEQMACAVIGPFGKRENVAKLIKW